MVVWGSNPLKHHKTFSSCWCQETGEMPNAHHRRKYIHDKPESFCSSRQRAPKGDGGIILRGDFEMSQVKKPSCSEPALWQRSGSFRIVRDPAHTENNKWLVNAQIIVCCRVFSYHSMIQLFSFSSNLRIQLVTQVIIQQALGFLHEPVYIMQGNCKMRITDLFSNSSTTTIQ